jgi:hypothetical protein
MDNISPPDPPDLALVLPRDVFYQLIHTVRGVVAPVSDSPDDIIRRDNDLMAKIAALLPANADEANLAAMYVIASARGIDLARTAQQHARTDPAFALKCDAQSAKHLRQAQTTRALLLRVQAARRKLESDGVAANRAAWTEHCAIALMADALGRTPPAEPPPPEPEPASDEAEPKHDPIAEAELYAVMYRDRAIKIRKHGGMPPDAKFGPPEDWLVQALVTGQSPALRALDQAAAEAK